LIHPSLLALQTCVGLDLLTILLHTSPEGFNS
jgi:hypothetical protein